MFVFVHLSTSIIYQFECNGDSVVRHLLREDFRKPFCVIPQLMEDEE